MENDPVFAYVQLLAENVSLWQLLAVAVFIWLVMNRAVVRDLPRYVSRFKIGDVEIELRELKEKVQIAQDNVEALENEILLERQRYDEILASFDPHAPVSDLSQVRQSLKAMSGSLEDMAPVLQGLAPGAEPEQVYAAAEILRTRRDPTYFSKLVDTLDRLARDPDLSGIRLHTVWTLTSALHKTLIADIKHSGAPQLNAEQLNAAKSMLQRLVKNPRVLMDRPDAPLEGVRGPAKWANDWIDRRLGAMAAAQAR